MEREILELLKEVHIQINSVTELLVGIKRNQTRLRMEKMTKHKILLL